MRNPHDRFEALAGAVVLGEATQPERVEFEAHARTCAGCRDDAAFGLQTVAGVAEARAAETWRPGLGGAVLDRIVNTRVSRNRRTIGAFGWAIALSFVLNAAFASGFSGWTAGFRNVGEGTTTVPTQTITLDRARSRVAAAPLRPAARASVTRLRSAPKSWWNGSVRVARVAARDRKVARMLRSTVPVAPHVGEAPARERLATALPAAFEPADVLAGLDIERAGATRSVALEPPAPCGPTTEQGGVRVVTDACAMTSGSPAPAP